ncbi:hypothetical protein KEM55_000241 [Ascosphaera atra]|nr:hypothetical protein KEM55_000241 [Ascosphaera atra]
MIEEIAGVVPTPVIGSLADAAQPSKTHSTYSAVAKVATDLVADGWSASQVLSQLYQTIVFNEAIPDVQKNEIVQLFSEIDKRLVDGADELLTIMDLTLRIAAILKRS